MPLALVVPDDYKYVVLSSLASAFLCQWHGTYVGGYRKAAKVPYPNCYATANEASTSPEKYKFNCAQRAHSNFLENLPIFLITQAIGGLEYPRFAATCGALYLLGRVGYTVGYVKSSKENGNGRYYGAVQYFGTLGLYITSAMTTWKFFF